MIETITTQLDISAGVFWALAALLVIQLAVAVWALIDLSRRPAVRGGAKWVWALVILVLSNSFIGPVLYVAFGRNVHEEVDVKAGSEKASNGERMRKAVDTLYGEGEGR